MSFEEWWKVNGVWKNDEYGVDSMVRYARAAFTAGEAAGRAEHELLKEYVESTESVLVLADWEEKPPADPVFEAALARRDRALLAYRARFGLATPPAPKGESK